MKYAFWDSSSLVPLCVQQPASAIARTLSTQYAIAVWWAAPVEVRSAIARLGRIGNINSNGQVQAIVLLERLRGRWREILPGLPVRARAEDMIDRFPLHAADALQLAAAWEWCQGHPRNRTFISGDVQLLDAARHLGFTAIIA
jgi:predicted nucleic acid-binding protein